LICLLYSTMLISRAAGKLKDYSYHALRFPTAWLRIPQADEQRPPSLDIPVKPETLPCCQLRLTGAGSSGRETQTTRANLLPRSQEIVMGFSQLGVKTLGSRREPSWDGLNFELNF